MKTTRFFLCAGISLLLCGIANAQIQAKQDGGIKIGTPPSRLGLSPSWQLTDRGLEINVGEIRFYADNGECMSFKSYTSQNKSAINPGTSIGGGSVIRPIDFCVLTGGGLKVGSATSKVWEVHTHSITSDLDIDVLSDRRMKSDIISIGEAKPYVMALRPVTYNLIPQEGYLGDTAELLNKAGFIAQEVMEVLPGAVGYSEEVDLYSLNYSHFIPYLTKTIQEQEEEITSLREQLRATEARMERIEAMLEELGAGNPEHGNAPGIMSTGNNRGNETMGNVHGMSGQNSQTESAPLQQNGESGSANEEVIGARLWQNVPNPTTGNTVIRYELPANCKGRIVLTSGNGQTVKIFDLPKRAGIDEIEVNGQSLNAGVYSYSLMVNGRIVDTKRMVVTE